MASTALSQISKSELAEKYERAKSAIKRVRAGAKVGTERTVTLALGGVGGFAAGALDHRMPEVGGLPTSAVVGLGLGILGITDMAGDSSQHLLAIGSGMLAGAAYQQGQKFSQGLNI